MLHDITENLLHQCYEDIIEQEGYEDLTYEGMRTALFGETTILGAIKNLKVPDILIQTFEENTCFSLLERAEYENRMNITSSEYVCTSDHITNSSTVFNSHFVKDSEGVQLSTAIENCSMIYGSSYVERSKLVTESTQVEGSRKIYKCQNIINCEDMALSKFCESCKHVSKSNGLVNSDRTKRSDNSSDLHFCFGCRDSNNLMFCSQLESQEYCIFNKPVSKTFYDRFFAQYQKIMIPFDTPHVEVQESLISRVYLISRAGRAVVYPKQILDWIHTLPNYNETLFKILTIL